MNRELRITEDGSHTLYVSELDESFHSIRGAIQESMHVFIDQGFHKIRESPIHLLELGMGTGLNVLLTLVESERLGIEVFYHAVEKYPLTPSEFRELNHEQFMIGAPTGSLQRLHEAQWGIGFNLADRFYVHKEQSDFRSMDPEGKFDLVYFDAFAPEKQPHLWTSGIFTKIYHLMNSGARLVSYTSKGTVRRALISCGFEVEKVPGPPGKWEMIRATKR